MSKTIIMACDAGKYDLKAIGRDLKGDIEDIRRVKFRAKMYDMDNGFAEAEGNSYKVELNEQTYIIGEQGEQGSNETSKTSLLHKLCAYTAITEYLESDTKDNHIKMVLACPITILKNAEAKEEYKNFIKGDGIIKIKVNDKNFEFIIDEITIKAEDSGILYLNPEWFEDKKVALLGFGGLNMNFTLFENGVAVPSSRFSTEHGSNRLEASLSDHLSVSLKGTVEVTEEDAERALVDGVLTVGRKPVPKTIQLIEKFNISFVENAKATLKKRGYDLDMMGGVVCVGGTVNKIKNALEDCIDFLNIPSEPQWASIEGLYRVAYLKYVKKQ